MDTEAAPVAKAWMSTTPFFRYGIYLSGGGGGGESCRGCHLDTSERSECSNWRYNCFHVKMWSAITDPTRHARKENILVSQLCFAIISGHWMPGEMVNLLSRSLNLEYHVKFGVPLRIRHDTGGKV